MFLQPTNNANGADAANVARDNAGMVTSLCTVDIKDRFIYRYNYLSKIECLFT